MVEFQTDECDNCLEFLALVNKACIILSMYVLIIVYDKTWYTLHRINCMYTFNYI